MAAAALQAAAAEHAWCAEAADEEEPQWDEEAHTCIALASAGPLASLHPPAPIGIAHCTLASALCPAPPPGIAAHPRRPQEEAA